LRILDFRFWIDSTDKSGGLYHQEILGQETKSEDKGITRSEFRYGSFRRVIPLPARVQNNSVEAEYKNGVLHLNLPKAEAEKNRVVKVQLG
jgi:HSP20 family protein